jgi:hypothetical protein
MNPQRSHVALHPPMTLHERLSPVLPQRSDEAASAMRQAMRAALDRALSGDRSVGEPGVLQCWQLVTPAYDRANAALGLLERLWAMGLIEELPRTEAEVCTQISGIVEALRARPAGGKS